MSTKKSFYEKFTEIVINGNNEFSKRLEDLTKELLSTCLSNLEASRKEDRWIDNYEVESFGFVFKLTELLQNEVKFYNIVDMNANISKFYVVECSVFLESHPDSCYNFIRYLVNHLKEEKVSECYIDEENNFFIIQVDL